MRMCAAVHTQDVLVNLASYTLGGCGRKVHDGDEGKEGRGGKEGRYMVMMG